MATIRNANALLALGLLLAACGDARPVATRSSSVETQCTRCHGGTDNSTGAPPRDLGGRDDTSLPSVGAHTAHVKAGAVSSALDCNECHVKPDKVSSPGHLDGEVTITWGALARTGGVSPSFDTATFTCSNVYCHGATLSGGTNTRPTWTKVDGSQAACGTCHGLPPTAHPVLASGSTVATCNVCHPETAKPDGTIDAASGKHVNGVPDGFAGHPAGWTDASSPDFHGAVAAQGASGCLQCHAETPPANVTTVMCSQCHGFNGAITCNGCHGSENAAPPLDTHGNTATTEVGVGAHQSHVQAMHGIAQAFDCTACHSKPTGLLSPGHLDGAVQVTGYTGTDQSLLAAVKDPTWNATSQSCATAYCHGATLAGGTNTKPTWTQVDGSQAACGTCHGLPPASLPSPNHPSYLFAAPCVGCHPGTATWDDGTGTNGIVQGAETQHVNGNVEYTFAGHPTGWATSDGGSHSAEACMGCGADSGITMQQYYDWCTPCHGKNGDFEPTGGTSRVSCGACHSAFFDATGNTTCWGFCH
jgi:predicted CxxxxCH...CXXCH cytochrome family protein